MDGSAGPSADNYFSASEHANTLLFGIQGLRERQDLCDVTICAEDKDFLAHKVILAASSPYFHAMFTNNHRESVENTIHLNGIDASTLELLLNFIYSSSLEIQEENVQNLLAGASWLQLPQVVDACCQFLKARICADNCLGIAAFADLHGCPDLHKSSWTFALENFTEIALHEEFLSVPAPLLIELLKSEDLQVHSEEEVLDSVLRWYCHDELSRADTIVSILRHVKLPLVPWKHLSDKLLQINSLASNPECHSQVASVRSLQTQPSLTETHAQCPNSTHLIPRRSVGKNKFIYAVGGETSPGRATVSSVEQFNPTKNTWKVLAPMPACRRGVGVGILNGLLYAVGGSDGVQALRLAECYDPLSNSWRRIADMNEKRSSVATAVLGGCLYAVGGYDGITSCLQSAECYDPQTDTWRYVASMAVPRSMACVCSINDQLLMVGGYNGVSDLQSCELYDPKTDSWTVVEGMGTRRCMAGVAVMDGLVYVVGGCDHAVSLKSIEAYNPTSGQWTLLSEMSEARSGLGVAVIGRRLYAIGGHTGSGSGYCSSVEQYNAETNSWSPAAAMAVSRRRFGCCS